MQGSSIFAMVNKSQKLGVPVLIIILSISLAETVRSNTNSNPKFLKNLSNWISKRTLMLMTNKRLVFPPRGTKLTLDPMLEVPMIDPNMFGIGSTFKMSLPLTVIFDKLSFMDSIFGDHNGYWKLISMNELQNLNRHKRSLNGTLLETSYNDTAKTRCNLLSSQRISLFRKLENLADSYGLGIKIGKGKSCILRAACEINENKYLLIKRYGMLGELITLLFSVKRFSDTCHKDYVALADYINAEKDGRRGQCEKYYEICDKSLFVSNDFP